MSYCDKKMLMLLDTVRKSFKWLFAFQEKFLFVSVINQLDAQNFVLQ